MSATTRTELERFRDFIAEQLSNGGSDLSPEETLDLWRANNPLSEELTNSVAEIVEVLADIEAGDPGRDAKEVLSDLRNKHGIDT